jgi:hypothetical protein
LEGGCKVYVASEILKGTALASFWCKKSRLS